ncbi:hypothetical protein HYQ44_005978 [Verticillium longisporum]|nr:hypothetical protein HYQ44_005978 [Verticillium longisporum]
MKPLLLATCDEARNGQTHPACGPPASPLHTASSEAQPSVVVVWVHRTTGLSASNETPRPFVSHKPA